jgi:hypothetical protein
LKRFLLALAVFAVLVPIAAVQASPVQEFSFQLKDVKPDGRFTVVFTSRSYDTTGGQPPDLTENFIRLPKAGVMAPQVRKKKYYCDAAQLIKDLQIHPVPNKTFASRVDNLKPFIKQLKKGKLAGDKKARANAEKCNASRLGQGTVQVDARPLINDLIPAVFFMFFGKGTVPGSLGTLQIVGMPDENSSLVKSLPITVQQTRVPAVANFVNDPTPDGKYGYKIVLPTGPIAGINVSFAELTATTEGFSAKTKKKSCVKKRKGKCVKKKVKTTRVFWFKRPVCPASGRLDFQAFYGYGGTPPNTIKEIELPCPNFKR